MSRISLDIVLSPMSTTSEVIKHNPLNFDRAGMSFTCCSDYRGLRYTAAFPFTMRPNAFTYAIFIQTI